LQAEALEQAKLPVFRQDPFGGMAGKTSTICNGTADICIASCSPGIIVKAELVVIGGCCGLYDRTGK